MPAAQHQEKMESSLLTKELSRSTPLSTSGPCGTMQAAAADKVKDSGAPRSDLSIPLTQWRTFGGVDPSLSFICVLILGQSLNSWSSTQTALIWLGTLPRYFFLNQFAPVQLV